MVRKATPILAAELTVARKDMSRVHQRKLTQYEDDIQVSF